MTDIHALFDCLEFFHPVSTAFNGYLRQVVKSSDYRRGSLLLKEGRVCNKIWWLRKGLVRFFYKLNQQEVSHCFIGENNMVLAIRSLYDQSPGKQAIQALEDASTWYIEYADLVFIYEHFPESQIIGRKIAEQYYSMLEQRLRAIALQKSIDRYRYLENHFPDLLQRVPLKYLASFLDLEVHTISRIRAKK